MKCPVLYKPKKKLFWFVLVCLSQCAMLNEKLDSLVKALSEDANAQLVPSGSISPDESDTDQSRPFRSREQLMLRANSLKKALRQIIDQAEKGNSSPYMSGK